jgi:cytochrome c oxidase subunit 2
MQMAVAAALLAPGLACAALEWNLPPPMTPMAQQMFDLHAYIFWICVVIFIGVFGVMFYRCTSTASRSGTPPSSSTRTRWSRSSGR